MKKAIDSLDLSVLSQGAQRPSLQRRRGARWWISRLLVVLVLGGGAAASGFYLWPLVVPPAQVELTTLVAREDVEARQRTSALVASGWAEPDPFATVIAPQIPGRVTSLPIVEGSKLVAGETVVAKLDTTLIDRDVALARAELELARQQRATLAIEVDQAQQIAARNLQARLRYEELSFKREQLRARRTEAEALHQEARRTLQQNAQLRTASAASLNQLESSREKLTQLEQDAAKLRTRIVWLAEDARAKRELADGESINELEATQAENAHATALAELTALELRMESQLAVIEAQQRAWELAQELAADPQTLEAKRYSAEAKVIALNDEIEALAPLISVAKLEMDDALSLNAAAINLHAKLSEVDALIASRQAKLERLQAEQALHTVYSPVSGVVLAVIARRGGMVAPQAEAQSICTAYDPEELQVRVDLPLADVPAVRVGQKVEVSSDGTGTRVYQGVVTRFVRQANLARNSLQVKVRIIDPDDQLRPDMLARCRFLPMREERDADQPKSESILRYFVPESAIQQDGEQSCVYIYDPRGMASDEGRAVRVDVEVSDADDAPEGMREIRGELSIGARVVTRAPAGMSAGDRIAPAK